MCLPFCHAHTTHFAQHCPITSIPHPQWPFHTLLAVLGPHAIALCPICHTGFWFPLGCQPTCQFPTCSWFFSRLPFGLRWTFVCGSLPRTGAVYIPYTSSSAYLTFCTYALPTRLTCLPVIRWFRPTTDPHAALRLPRACRAPCPRLRGSSPTWRRFARCYLLPAFTYLPHARTLHTSTPSSHLGPYCLAGTRTTPVAALFLRSGLAPLPPRVCARLFKNMHTLGSVGQQIGHCS